MGKLKRFWLKRDSNGKYTPIFGDETLYEDIGHAAGEDAMYVRNIPELKTELTEILEAGIAHEDLYITVFPWGAIEYWGVIEDKGNENGA